MENQFTVSLWGDEGFSAILSMRPLPEIIRIIANDTSPPLWNITEWIVFNTLGTDEVYIRGLAFLFFTLTVFFVYKTGAFLWSKRTGVIAAVLTFLNPFFFIYAFEGRMYSIMALGVTASMYYFLRIFYAEKIKKTDKLGYVIASLWALYSHHFAIFALVTQGLWFLYELGLGKRSRAKKMFKLFIFTGIGYVPWLYPLYTQTKMVGGGFWLGTPDLEDFKVLLYDYLGEGIKQLDYTIPVIKLKIYELALYLVFAVLIFRRWHKSIKKSLLLLLWFLTPIALTWLISQKFQSIFFNRYLLYTIPGAMLVLASKRRKKISEIVILATIVVFAIIDYHYFVNPTKLPFRELAAYVKETRTESDFLINWDPGKHKLWESKYYGIPAPIYVRSEGDLPFFVGTALMTEEDIVREIPEEAARVGVITTGPVEEVDLDGYTETSIKEYKDLKFIWHEKS